jgi:hypothetical protein
MPFTRCVVLGIVAAGCASTTRVPIPDAEVAHSPTGQVAFVRRTPDRLVPTALGDEQATELWIADADGAHARRLLTGVAADSAQHALASFSSPRFSPDGEHVYFLSRAWVTSDAVHVVDVRTGRERFVAPGNSLEVIPQGPLAGCLLVTQHRHRADGDGSFDWTWLFDPAGRELGLAATDSDAEGQVAEFLSGRVPGPGDGSLTVIPSDVHCQADRLAK